MPKKLSPEQEFDILKIVLDKVMWLGLAIIAYGLYQMVSYPGTVWYGVSLILGGSILIVIFMMMLVREYEHME